MVSEIHADLPEWSRAWSLARPQVLQQQKELDASRAELGASQKAAASQAKELEMLARLAAKVVAVGDDVGELRKMWSQNSGRTFTEVAAPKPARAVEYIYSYLLTIFSTAHRILGQFLCVVLVQQG